LQESSDSDQFQWKTKSVEFKVFPFCQLSSGLDKVSEIRFFFPQDTIDEVLPHGPWTRRFIWKHNKVLQENPAAGKSCGRKILPLSHKLYSNFNSQIKKWTSE
jgi:hypothetical protein